MSGLKDITRDGKRFIFMARAKGESSATDCNFCAFSKNNSCTAKDSDCTGGFFMEAITLKLDQDKTQVGGDHYLKAIQPWDIIRAWSLGFFRGNIIKYILRCTQKNGVEDLKKARHYLDYCIENYDQLKKDGLL